MFSSHACFKCCLKSVHDIKEPGAAQISFIQYQFLGNNFAFCLCSRIKYLYINKYIYISIYNQHYFSTSYSLSYVQTNTNNLSRISVLPLLLLLRPLLLPLLPLRINFPPLRTYHRHAATFIQYVPAGSTSEGAHCQWKEGGGNGGSGGDGFQPKYKQDLDPSGAGS